MKKLIVIMSCVISVSAFSEDLSPKKELLSDVKHETKKCAVQIVNPTNENGSNSVLGFKSVCDTLVISSTSEAQILIDGEWLTAKISESKEADGGDLDDLFIVNKNGKILATKTNIPAYDSIIVAMAGDSNFNIEVENKN
jgi:hypothetical protein